MPFKMRELSKKLSFLALYCRESFGSRQREGTRSHKAQMLMLTTARCVPMLRESAGTAACSHKDASKRAHSNWRL